MFAKISYWFFKFRYKHFLVRYGIDFYDCGDPDFDPNC